MGKRNTQEEEASVNHTDDSPIENESFVTDDEEWERIVRNANRSQGPIDDEPWTGW